MKKVLENQIKENILYMMRHEKKSKANELYHLTRQWVKTWENAGKAIKKIHDNRIRQLNPSFCIKALEDSFQSAIKHKRSCTTSGLVMQQKLFSKLIK